jgi:hypothetical protein
MTLFIFIVEAADCGERAAMIMIMRELYFVLSVLPKWGFGGPLRRRKIGSGIGDRARQL